MSGDLKTNHVVYVVSSSIDCTVLLSIVKVSVRNENTKNKL